MKILEILYQVRGMSMKNTSEMSKMLKKLDEIQEKLENIEKKCGKSETNYYGSYSPCIGDRHEMGG